MREGGTERKRERGEKGERKTKERGRSRWFRTALRTGTTVLTEPEFDYVLAAPRLRGLRSRSFSPPPSPPFPPPCHRRRRHRSNPKPPPRLFPTPTLTCQPCSTRQRPNLAATESSWVTRESWFLFIFARNCVGPPRRVSEDYFAKIISLLVGRGWGGESWIRSCVISIGFSVIGIVITSLSRLFSLLYLFYDEYLLDLKMFAATDGIIFRK